MSSLADLLNNPWLQSAIWVAIAVAAGLIAHGAAMQLLQRLWPTRYAELRDTLLRRIKPHGRLVLPALALAAVLPELPLPGEAAIGAEHLAVLISIAMVGWSVAVGLHLLEDFVILRTRHVELDPFRARQIRTRSQLLRRLGATMLLMITVGMMLMTFPAVKHIGVSMFASAGVAGLVAGLAARPLLSNLFAGLQIAVAQPIRIEDVVIVEGEWGWIEEILNTYVVVRTWDLRRLILPLTYFIEKPFQNWTRNSSDLLGVVLLYTDYTVPVDELRCELERICRDSPLWDGKVAALQVTDAKTDTLELRALVSARDAGAQFDLRCLVREKLILFLQRQHPRSLPRTRVDVTQPAGVAATQRAAE